MDLQDILAIVWKRKLTLVLVVLAATGTAAAFAYTRTKMYASTATLALTPNVQKGQGLVASDNLATLLSTYAAIAESADNRRSAEQILGHPLNASVTASSTAGTGILKIAATSAKPRDAAAGAQALSQAFQDSIRSNSQLLVVQVVDPPTVPTTPVQPRPPLIVATGLVLGIGLGIALVLLIERWFDRIETPEDVADLTPLPVLGYIPRERALRAGGPSSLVWDRPELAKMQEVVRTLRTNLQFTIDSDQGVLQITSSSQGEGKSTVAANIAIALAGVGISTLLVDGDLRAPRQHAIFQLPNDEGFSTLLNQPDDPIPPPWSTAYKGLSVLTSGPPLPSPTETMATQIEGTMRRLRELGTFIVVDCPPILPVSDARLIATEVDFVLMVAAAGRTRGGSLKRALDHLRMSKAHVIGLVLNQVTGSVARSSGYGEYYPTAEPVRLVNGD